MWPGKAAVFYKICGGFQGRMTAMVCINNSLFMQIVAGLKIRIKVFRIVAYTAVSTQIHVLQNVD